MANNNIGPKRLVVGAHYGLRDWLAQRVTALVMVAYVAILLIAFLTGSNFSYEGWAVERLEDAISECRENIPIVKCFFIL